jgi:hypothetical protein
MQGSGSILCHSLDSYWCLVLNLIFNNRFHALLLLEIVTIRLLKFFISPINMQNFVFLC